jgi:gliding motility-associated-like protein
MWTFFPFKNNLLFFLLFLGLSRFHAQNFYARVEVTDKECLPGSVILVLPASTANETITISWSTGHSNVKQITEIENGDYSVAISNRYKQDTLILQKDTTIYFTVGKRECEVSLPKYFSPNSDGYNDLLVISNADKHPNFEFSVYNKWGQQVHKQKKYFTAWDGTWGGFPLPDGTYYYIFIYDSSNKEHHVKGDVTILR